MQTRSTNAGSSRTATDRDHRQSRDWLDAGDLARLEVEGLVTIDCPFEKDLIAAANDTVDRLYPASEEIFDSQVYARELLELIHHPFFEEASKVVLRANDVQLASAALKLTSPQPEASSTIEPLHVDFKCTSDDLNASPRRMLVSYMLWLSDVTERASPLHYCPGSHLAVIEDTDRHPERNNHWYQQPAPPLVYAEPRPVLARTGQVSILVSTLVHAGSRTPGPVGRRALFVDYKPNDADFRYFEQYSELIRTYLSTLRDHFPADRMHLLSSD